MVVTNIRCVCEVYSCVNKDGLLALTLNQSPTIAISMIWIVVMVVVVMVAMVAIKRLSRSFHFAFSFLWFRFFLHRTPPEAMPIEATIPTIETSQAISTKAIVWTKSKSIVRTRRPLFSGFFGLLRILSRPFPEMATVETVPVQPSQTITTVAKAIVRSQSKAIVGAWRSLGASFH